MASPQIEDGYVKIANEIIEALCRVSIGLGNAQVLYFILRKTYGYQKKEDQISLSQIQEGTGMSRRNVIYCLQNLVILWVRKHLMSYLLDESQLLALQLNTTGRHLGLHIPIENRSSTPNYCKFLTKL